MHPRSIFRARRLLMAALVCAVPTASLLPAASTVLPAVAGTRADAAAALPAALEQQVASDMVVDWLEQPTDQDRAWAAQQQPPAHHGIGVDGDLPDSDLADDELADDHPHAPPDPPASRYEAATSAPAPRPGHGFAVFSESARWLPGGYTVRLAGDGQIEEYRDELVASARAATEATGIAVRVAPGLGGALQPGRGEITVVLGVGPCGDSAIGCGGPHLTSAEVLAGQVWIAPAGLGLRQNQRTHLAAHELGHALGLQHYTGDWGDGRQVMYPVIGSVPTYRGGDRAGLTFMAGGHDRPAGELTGVAYAAGHVRVTGTLASGERVRVTAAGASVDAQAAGGSFTAAVPAGAGQHRACAASLDAGTGFRRQLGCVDVLAPGAPFGRFEGAGDGFETVVVSGWAIDPQTAAPIEVEVRRNGAMVATAAADRNRGDVSRLHPNYGLQHGFRLEVPAVAGANELCVRALGVGGGGDTDLGCHRVTHDVDPIGALEATQVEHLGATVSGWALDPNTPDAVDVAITVDGAVAVAPGTARADGDRPDVGRQHPAHGPAHGFSQRILLTPGEREVCLTARNVGLGTDRSIGCRRVTVRGPAGAPGTADGAAGGLVGGVLGGVLDGLAGTASRVAPIGRLVPEVAGAHGPDASAST